MKSIILNKLSAAALGLILSASSMSLVAADGSLGSTSNADSLITINVVDAVKISSLDAITFADYGGADTGATSASDNFCVYVNGGGTYTLTASTSSDSYTLTGAGTADTISYTVAFNGTNSASTTSVAVNVASAEFTGSESLDCGAADNANVNIMISNAELLTALTDTYTQTLTVTVTPI